MEHALIVDDAPFMRDILGELMDVMGIETTLCSNGAEALAAISGTSFDYLITSLMMPDMGGFELCHSVRKRPGFRNLPIVMLTAKQLNIDERKELMKLNARLVVKPFSPTLFVDTLRRPFISES